MTRTRYLKRLILVAALALTLPAPEGTLAGDAATSAQAIWHWPVSPPLSLYSFRGYWYPVFQLDRAWALLGGVDETSRWSGPQAPARFPVTREAISRYHLIVVVDMDTASWPEGTLELCREYVRQGGAMLFFGGLHAFSAGYQGSPLEAISPVSFRAEDSLVHVPEGTPLTPGPQAQQLEVGALDWNGRPQTYWYHRVEPKQDALIIVQADTNAILVAGRYGKGRVAVFAGTVMGVPKEGQTPFWMWEDWPDLMARTTRWLTAPDSGRRAAVPSPYTADLEQVIIDTLKAMGAKDTLKERQVLESLLAVCRNNPTPTELLKHLGSARHDIPQAPAIAIVDALHGQVCPAAIAAATGLIDANRPILAGAGLQALAMAPPAGLVNALESVYRQRELSPIETIFVNIPGAAAFSPQARDADLDMEDILKMIEQPREHTPLLPGMTDAIIPDPDTVRRQKTSHHQFQLASLAAMGYAGLPDSIPFLRRVIAEHQRDRRRDPHEGWGRTKGDELHDEALLAALLCGDATVAGPMVDLLLQLDFTVIGMFGRGWGDRDETRRAELHAAAQQIRAWSWRAANRIRHAPPAVLPALASRIAEAQPDETWIVPLAHRLLGRSLRHEPLPAAAKAVLRTSPIPAINELVTD